MINYKKDDLIRVNEIIPNKKQLSDELFIGDEELLPIKFTKIDGEWYLWKFITGRKLLNELIGSLLAKYIGLDTVEYIPGVNESGKLVVLSKNFREFGFKYFMADEIYEEAVPIFNEYTEKANYSTECLKQLNKNLQNDVLKLCILDMYMGQLDRHSGNLDFFKVGDKISLAPIYDYSNSFSYWFKYYFNPFVVINFKYKDIEKFLNEYPECFDTLNILNNLNMYDVLKEIEKKHNIKIELSAYSSYEDCENIKLLKKFK